MACVLAVAVANACSPAPGSLGAAEEQAPMYPDYTDITIPANIAPLNFLLRDTDGGERAKRIRVYADGGKLASARGNGVQFGERTWKKVLEKNVGREMEVAVLAKYKGGWKEFRHFSWTVSADRVDPYLTYRLIEPDYEVFNEIVLQQRCVENFETDNFSDYKVIGNKCMNCHCYSWQNPDTSMFYVRGEGGGAMLNTGGKLRKLALKGEGMISGSVYFGFSPSGRYIVFSTNHIIPSYHSSAGKRMEVYDDASDVYVADLEENKFIRDNRLAAPDVLETFPCFSPDGKYVYYCTADKPDTLDLAGIEGLKYSLCRLPFGSLADFAAGAAEAADTVYNARIEGHSVCHPRISPDGSFLCFSIADFGTFPLWHSESDLLMMNLSDFSLIPMTAANSPKSDTYHSWSSNSRWLVFASKRDDGVYGKPYFTHVDADGNCSKAFVLPQKHPDFYDNFLRSYNAPELGTGPLPFSAFDLKEALNSAPEKFE